MEVLVHMNLKRFLFLLIQCKSALKIGEVVSEIDIYSQMIVEML